MKKLIIGLLSVTAIASLGAAVGCAKTSLPSVVVNGGFESGDLSGWTVEYGDAYDDDSVSSRKTFSYSADVDPHGYVIPVNQTGNWYLSGKGFDNNRPSTCIGAIRSTNFVLGGDGTVSMKLAGGAQASARSDTAEQKPASEVCYVGIYRASDDKMIAYQTNRYFAEDASNIELTDYENGTCYTDNFCQYKIDLSAYIGEELYIRIVDNDTGYYYGYLSVDDIRIGKSAEPQQEGAYFTKTANRETVQANSVYEIANGGFEAGSLAGWEIVEGLAFSDDGVNCNPYWWAEQIPYEREGNYHYGYYNPTATGRMKSGTFIVGGTGYVTYKLGGCSDNNTAYLRFMKVNEEGDDEEVLRVSNFAFKDMQFPNVQNGMRIINLNQYRVNLSPFMGERMYIEVVDENSSSDMAGCIVLDSVNTYYTEIPQFTDWFDVEYEIREDIPENEFQVKNGGFETGDLTGWTIVGNLGEVSADSTWWAERLPFNKNGRYHFSGLNNEGGRGTLTSSAFTVGGACKMTFSLGGAHDPICCYISLLDEQFNEVARYGNPLFHDAGLGLINRGTNLANMVSYWADLSAWRGRKLYIRITDNADSNWGLVTADSFITYYEENETNRFPANSIEAIDILNNKNLPQSEYQIANGNFESGNLDGWEINGNIGNISYDYLWWNEWYTYNKDGLFFFSGFQGDEKDKGTLTSSVFTVGGAGIITYRLGGGKNTDLCYLEVIDAENPDLIYFRFGNEMFSTRGGVFTGVPITVGCEGFGANMILYKADISALMGRKVKLRLTDNASSDWGLLFADDFVTYYADENQVPLNAVTATNIVPKFANAEKTLNLVYNEDRIKLEPVNYDTAVYSYTFELVQEVDEVTLADNFIILNPNGELTIEFNKTYEVNVKITLKNSVTDKETEQIITVTLTAIYDNRLIFNGGFETGDLTGWTLNGNIGGVSDETVWWAEELPFEKDGEYFFNGWYGEESETGTLESTAFILGGSGWITFKLGGGKNTELCYIEIYDKTLDTVVARYGNTEFKDNGIGMNDLNGSCLANLVQYKADLSAYIGDELIIRIVDNAENDWGLIFADSFITFYESEADLIDDAVSAENKIKN